LVTSVATVLIQRTSLIVTRLSGRMPFTDAPRVIDSSVAMNLQLTLIGEVTFGVHAIVEHQYDIDQVYLDDSAHKDVARMMNRAD
jgi:hypothetical protein